MCLVINYKNFNGFFQVLLPKKYEALKKKLILLVFTSLNSTHLLTLLMSSAAGLNCVFFFVAYFFYFPQVLHLCCLRQNAFPCPRSD